MAYCHRHKDTAVGAQDVCARCKNLICIDCTYWAFNKAYCIECAKIIRNLPLKKDQEYIVIQRDKELQKEKEQEFIFHLGKDSIPKNSFLLPYLLQQQFK